LIISSTRTASFGGSEPLSMMARHRFTVLASLQLDKSFLHNIPCPVAIAEDARGVLQEGQLEAAQECRQVIVIGWDYLGHAHKLFPSSNAREPELLTESYKWFRRLPNAWLFLSRQRRI
jgi:hypothetical protein